MKISDINGINVEQLQTQRTEAATPPAPNNQGAAATSSGVDVIHLSPKARLMQKASQIVAQTPEVRSDKVAPLQEAVQQSSYSVNSQKVANSMISDMIMER